MSAPDGPVGLVLASASPRRRELLGRLGLDFEVVVADVDETVLPGEEPADYVLRVASDKANAVRSTIGRADRVVLASDTTVVLEGRSLGKPADTDDAARTLRALAGRGHHVLTAVVVVDADGIVHTALDRTAVHMSELSDDEIDWYVATGEPMDKAGSYALQGAGAVLVERIDGDPTTVIGLPLRTSVELLGAAGLRWPPSASD